MSGEYPKSVTELSKGVLYAVGGELPADRPYTWFPTQAEGILPSQCYVLKNEQDFILIDTGLGIHRDEIRHGIAALIEGVPNRSLYLTRREPDSMINLQWLLKEFRFRSVSCGGAISPLDFFDSMDEASAEAQLQATAGAKLTWLSPGSAISFGGICIEVLRTNLRVLAANHFYEYRTRTFFGSDGWSFLTMSPGANRIRSTKDGISKKVIADFLAMKFDWLMGAKVDTIVAEIENLGRHYEIERICGSCGCIIEGKDVVRFAIGEMIAAIKMLAAKDRPSRLATFDFDGARAVLAS